MSLFRKKQPEPRTPAWRVGYDTTERGLRVFIYTKGYDPRYPHATADKRLDVGGCRLDDREQVSLLIARATQKAVETQESLDYAKAALESVS